MATKHNKVTAEDKASPIKVKRKRTNADDKASPSLGHYDVIKDEKPTRIQVRAKKGESPSEAISRVGADHGCHPRQFVSGN
jgi:hypothetical protein